MRGCFPERHPPAVLLPERFRGGCAFGAGLGACLALKGRSLPQSSPDDSSPRREARVRGGAILVRRKAKSTGLAAFRFPGRLLLYGLIEADVDHVGVKDVPARH